MAHNQVLSGTLGTLGVQHLAGAPGISIGLAPTAADRLLKGVPQGVLGGQRGTGRGRDAACPPAENSMSQSDCSRQRRAETLFFHLSIFDTKVMVLNGRNE